VVPVPASSSAAAVEQALRVVPGVVEATVLVGEQAEGAEVRLVLEDDVDEVAIARAVHRMLRLRFGDGLAGDRVELVLDVTDGTAPRLRSLPPPDEVNLSEHDGDEDDEAEVVDLGLEIDALLADLDRRSGRDFPAAVLAASVRHPAGVVASDAGDAAQESPAEPAESPRLSIARLTVVSDHHHATATVTLRGPSGELQGFATGPGSDTEVLGTVARATLGALAPLLDDDAGLALAAVSTPRVGEATVAVVQVRCGDGPHTERLTGASEVRDDVAQAVIRATLDAMNRRLPVLAPFPPRA